MILRLSSDFDTSGSSLSLACYTRLLRIVGSNIHSARCGLRLACLMSYGVGSSQLSVEILEGVNVSLGLPQLRVDTIQGSVHENKTRDVILKKNRSETREMVGQATMSTRHLQSESIDRTIAT